MNRMDMFPQTGSVSDLFSKTQSGFSVKKREDNKGKTMAKVIKTIPYALCLLLTECLLTGCTMSSDSSGKRTAAQGVMKWKRRSES